MGEQNTKIYQNIYIFRLVRVNKAFNYEIEDDNFHLFWLNIIELSEHHVLSHISKLFKTYWTGRKAPN